MGVDDGVKTSKNLLTYFLFCIVIALVLVFVQLDNKIDNLQEQIEHQDEAIQNLRNDLNDLDWYYDNRFHFKDLEDDARDIAIEDLYDRLENLINYDYNQGE